ncbi:MAG TPA: hypothetical protein VG122_13765 [Gemmata sp.]|nr:hypothetical protein [Gemmata sp.]
MKELPKVLEDLREAEEDTLREFNKRDPVLSIDDPNYNDMYERLHRIDAALQSNPRVAHLRRKRQEAEAVSGEFQEIENLIGEYDANLMREYPAYVYLGEKLDVDKQANAMRVVYAQLRAASANSAPIEEDRKEGARSIDPEDHAIALLLTSPPLAFTEIADRVGVSRTQLYRFNRFRVACERAGRPIRQNGEQRRGILGSKDIEGNLEAYSDNDNVDG